MPDLHSMAALDILVIIGILTGTIASAVMFRREGIRGRRLIVPVWLSFYGLVLIATMLAHSGEILYRTLTAGTPGTSIVSRYNFRVYSLLLLGALLIWAGLACLRAAPGVSRGTTDARRAATRATVIVLLIVVPLIPIQRVFGVLLTVLSMLSLLVLISAGRRATES